MTVRSPSSVLATKGCLAEVLSCSDQHVTVLLSHRPQKQGGDAALAADVEKSLLKLTVVPAHRAVLGSGNKSDDDKSQEVSDALVSYLNGFAFHLTSESGAEYSYYDARPKDGLFSGILSHMDSFIRSMFAWNSNNNSLPPSSSSNNQTSFKVELISPASERQIQRATPAPALVMIEETPVMYQAVAKPFIQSIVDGGSLSWVQNVVDGTKEKERLLLDTVDYVLNVDTKWKSHPDATTVPREAWYQHETVVDLYCLAIVKDGAAIRTLRDLRRRHIPMLQSMLTEATATIEQVYGIPRNQLRIFAHYQPQFYHFHVHFTRLGNENGCQVERGHLVTDMIQNLELDDLFYAKRTISYKLPTNDKLYQQIQAWQRKESLT
eukprot:scaffold1192_cov169-Amphora_coffeaeformis.AAC.10